MEPTSSNSPKMKKTQPRRSSTSTRGKPHCYKGVRMRTWGKWVSEIRVPKTGERIWLGSYDDAEKAALAYDAAQYCLHGACGRFNFPYNKRPRIPDDLVGLSKQDIKAIAFNYAFEQQQEQEQDKSSGVSCNLLDACVDKSSCVAEDNPVQECTEIVDEFQLDEFLALDVEWIDTL